MRNLRSTRKTEDHNPNVWNMVEYRRCAVPILGARKAMPTEKRGVRNHQTDPARAGLPLFAAGCGPSEPATAEVGSASAPLQAIPRDSRHTVVAIWGALSRRDGSIGGDPRTGSRRPVALSRGVIRPSGAVPLVARLPVPSPQREQTLFRAGWGRLRRKDG